MDHTLLHFSVGVDAGNGFREAGEAVDAGDQDILHSAVMQIGQNR